MPKAAPIVTSFNGGEWSPMMAGRSDIKYYTSACRKMRNFVPTPQGPARFRPGFRHVQEVKDSADRTWLWRFEFNIEQAYVLEFGDQYVRFYSNHGVVESAPSVPLEVVTPYLLADLTASDGTFNLRFVQSGDVLYICHPDYAVRKLVRTGPAAFSLTAADFVAGPFQDIDPAETITVYASARTGAGITLTASSAIFTSDYIGAQFFIEQRNTDDIKQWEAGKSITSGSSPGDLRRSDGKNYKALNTATTGGVKPTHSVGSKYDGDTGVQWSFQDPGYGWATITAVGGGGTTATATVVSDLPYGCVGAGQATTRWAFAAWTPVDGYPTVVTFFRERLTFLRGQDGWTSVAGDYENFNRKDTGGLITDDMSVVFTISSDRANRIEWAAPSDIALLIGTAGDEHALMEITSSDPFGPANKRALKQSEYGSKHVPEVRVGEGVLFVQKSGRKLRDATLAESVNERWVANDTTVLAEHITNTGIVTMAYQQEPDSVVWAGRADGVLIGFTVNRQQDVRGWHRHPLGGVDAKVESVITIPSPAGDRDEVWAIISRTIDGATKRYVEWMEYQLEEDDDPADAFYVDSGLTYDGVPTSTLSGLDHLEGETVAILADGATHPTRVVTAGAITLQREASIISVGLPYTGILSPMPIDAGAADGTSQGKTRRIHKCGIKFYMTGGAKYGRDENSTLDRIELRGSNDPMDAPPPLFTGDKVVSWPDGYEGEGNITIVQDQPQPCNVVALMPSIVTQDTPGSKNR